MASDDALIAPASRCGEVMTSDGALIAPASRCGEVMTSDGALIAPASRCGEVMTSDGTLIAPASRCGEEGLDICDVDLIVCYDALGSESEVHADDLPHQVTST
jgi:hypothetical protein